MNNLKYTKNDIARILNRWVDFVTEMKVAHGKLTTSQGLSNFKSYEGLVEEFEYDLKYRAVLEEIIQNNLLTEVKKEAVLFLDNEFIKNTLKIDIKFWHLKNLPNIFADRIPYNVDDDFKKALGTYHIINDS